MKGEPSSVAPSCTAGGIASIINDIDADRSPFTQPQGWTGNCAVVTGSLDGFARRKLERDRRDTKRVVSLHGPVLAGGPGKRWYNAKKRRSGSVFEQQTAVDGHDGCVLPEHRNAPPSKT